MELLELDYVRSSKTGTVRSLASFVCLCLLFLVFFLHFWNNREEMCQTGHAGEYSCHHRRGVHPTGVSARFSGYPRYSGASETLLDSCQYCACHCTTYCYVCVCRCYPECHDTVEVALFPLSPPLLRTRCSHFPLHC